MSEMCLRLKSASSEPSRTFGSGATTHRGLPRGSTLTRRRLPGGAFAEARAGLGATAPRLCLSHTTLKCMRFFSALRIDLNR
jgi:hypothetical protein